MDQTAKGDLPSELDFFKYAQGSSVGKRKIDDRIVTRAMKRAKLEDGEDTVEQDEDDGSLADTNDDEPSPVVPRQRVTAKGARVPEPVETFEALKERYTVPSLLLSNLAQSGYKQPTGIQSHGIPILLEVLGTASV